MLDENSLSSLLTSSLLDKTAPEAGHATKGHNRKAAESCKGWGATMGPVPGKMPTPRFREGLVSVTGKAEPYS